MAKVNVKADLSLLNKLVKEVNDQLQTAELHNRDDATKADHQQYVVELAKAMGMLTTISTEAMLLVADVSKLTTVAPPSANSNPLLDMFSELKGKKSVS